MSKERIVHFGAGALGRGLVVPILVQSNKEVILVDTNPILLEKLKRDKYYSLIISDATNDKQKKIEIVDAISSLTEEDTLLRYLEKVNTVTTSVRRENLIYVAKVLAKAWKHQNGENKQVICCENVEHVGDIFKDLLLQQAKNDEEKLNLQHIKVPDTIVDRICSVDEETLEVTSEKFYECSVDAAVVADTGIEAITSVDNIVGRFYRKRYLLNSYADAISFIALSKGLTYLYEAASDPAINESVETYIEMLKVLLHAKYHMSMDSLNEWARKYQDRLMNKAIPRELDTVARNLDTKLTLEERFVYPIVELAELGYDYSKGIAFIKTLIQANILTSLEHSWCKNEAGKIIYEEFRKAF